MNNKLPRAYLGDVNLFVDMLGTGYTSKSEYSRLDSTLYEMTNIQAVQFLELIKEGVVEKLNEHRKVCQDPTNCGTLNEGEKSINSIERRISERKPFVPAVTQSEPETPNHPTDHTTARQVLAIRFLLQYAKIDAKTDKAAERFIHFLTGKSKDNIYKSWRVASNKELETNRVEDLQFVRKFFEDLGSVEIVKMLNNEIDTK